MGLWDTSFVLRFHNKNKVLSIVIESKKMWVPGCRGMRALLGLESFPEYFLYIITFRVLKIRPKFEGELYHRFIPIVRG